MTPAARSTECAAAHRPCGRLPSRATRRAHERDVAVPAARRRAGAGMGVARGGRHLPSSLFDPGNLLLHLHHHLRFPSMSRICSLLLPPRLSSSPAPAAYWSPALASLSRPLLSLSPLPAGGRRRAQDRHQWLTRLSGGSCPPFASALLGDRAGRIRRSFFPGFLGVESKGHHLTCLEYDLGWPHSLPRSLNSWFRSTAPAFCLSESSQRLSRLKEI